MLLIPPLLVKYHQIFLPIVDIRFLFYLTNIYLSAFILSRSSSVRILGKRQLLICHYLKHEINAPCKIFPAPDVERLLLVSFRYKGYESLVYNHVGPDVFPFIN